MPRSLMRLATVVALVGIVTMSGATLLAETGPSDPARTTRDPADVKLGRGGFQPCPWPPCMAPCSFPPEPEVLCTTGPGGGVSVTSFFCCCCGGGQAFYRPL